MALLGGATALLNPIACPEPFGLAMIEARACGTPVVALRSGSAAEIVDDGVTGLLCDDMDRLVHRLGEVEGIDRLDPLAPSGRLHLAPELPTSIRQLHVTAIRVAGRSLDISVAGDDVDVRGADGLEVVPRAHPAVSSVVT